MYGSTSQCPTDQRQLPDPFRTYTFTHSSFFGATECTKLLLQHKEIKVDIKNRIDNTTLELEASVRSSNNAEIVTFFRKHLPTESTVFISLIFILYTHLCFLIHLFNSLCFIFFLCCSLHGYAFHYIPLSCIYVNLLGLLLLTLFNSFRFIRHTSCIHIFLPYKSLHSFCTFIIHCYTLLLFFRYLIIISHFSYSPLVFLFISLYDSNNKLLMGK